MDCMFLCSKPKSIKLTYGGYHRRFTITQPLSSMKFKDLVAATRTLFPELSDKQKQRIFFSYEDNEKDTIHLDSDEELKEAIQCQMSSNERDSLPSPTPSVLRFNVHCPYAMLPGHQTPFEYHTNPLHGSEPKLKEIGSPTRIGTAKGTKEAMGSPKQQNLTPSVVEGQQIKSPSVVVMDSSKLLDLLESDLSQKYPSNLNASPHSHQQIATKLNEAAGVLSARQPTDGNDITPGVPTSMTTPPPTPTSPPAPLPTPVTGTVTGTAEAAATVTELTDVRVIDAEASAPVVLVQESTTVEQQLPESTLKGEQAQEPGMGLAEGGQGQGLVEGVQGLGGEVQGLPVQEEKEGSTQYSTTIYMDTDMGMDSDDGLTALTLENDPDIKDFTVLLHHRPAVEDEMDGDGVMVTASMQEEPTEREQDKDKGYIAVEKNEKNEQDENDLLCWDEHLTTTVVREDIKVVDDNDIKDNDDDDVDKAAWHKVDTVKVSTVTNALGLMGRTEKHSPLSADV